MMSNFTNYHLAITRDTYEQRRPGYTQDSQGLVIEEISPNYESFRMLLERVGGPWGWTRRPRYYNNRTELSLLLKHPQSRLFVFRLGGFPIGYTWIVPYTKGHRDLFPNLDEEQVIQIENFGLFPEATGKKYGQYILPQLFALLFQDHNVVYLSSRSTNHTRVIPFYQALGMEIVAQELLPDDLIPEIETIPYVRRNRA